MNIYMNTSVRGLAFKNKILISIPPDLDQKFRQFLALKYQRVEKGLISHEISEAMSHWIALHTKAQTELISKPVNPTPRVVQVFIGLKQYLLSKYYLELAPGSAVPDKFLRESIVATRGSDKRTIRHWLRTLSQFNLIKRLNSKTWELM